MPAHATWMLFSDTCTVSSALSPSYVLDMSRDIRLITLMLIPVHCESRHLSLKLSHDLEPDESACQYRVPDSITLTCGAPTLCTIAPLVSPLVQCDHVAQKMRVARSERPIRRSHPSSRCHPPAYTMLTRPSAAHEDLHTCLCPLAGAQVPCAIFDRLALLLRTWKPFHESFFMRRQLRLSIAFTHRCRFHRRRRARACSR